MRLVLRRTETASRVRSPSSSYEQSKTDTDCAVDDSKVDVGVCLLFLVLVAADENEGENEEQNDDNDEDEKHWNRIEVAASLRSCCCDVKHYCEPIEMLEKVSESACSSAAPCSGVSMDSVVSTGTVQDSKTQNTVHPSEFSEI